MAINSFAAYSDKSIKFLVPYPLGGTAGQVARILVQPLTKYIHELSAQPYRLSL